MVTIHQYTTLHFGPRVLMFGAIHGNEPCGVVALNQIREEIETGRLLLRKGRLTLVPVCNPEAFRQNKRYIDENLNRIVDRIADPKTYEARLSNVLAPLLEDCDALLDLHSQKSLPEEPFIFGGPRTPDAIAFESAIGTPLVLSGFKDAYDLTPEAQGRFTNVLGTTGYARQFGAVANTIECGRNGDPKAVEIAYQAVLNVLSYFDMIDMPRRPLATTPRRHFALKHVWFRQEGETPAQSWQHLQPVKKGDVLSRDQQNYPIATAPDDGFLVFPDLECPTGEEWLYWSVEE